MLESSNPDFIRRILFPQQVDSSQRVSDQNEWCYCILVIFARVPLGCCNHTFRSPRWKAVIRQNISIVRTVICRAICTHYSLGGFYVVHSASDLSASDLTATWGRLHGRVMEAVRLQRERHRRRLTSLFDWLLLARWNLWNRGICYCISFNAASKTS